MHRIRARRTPAHSPSGFALLLATCLTCAPLLGAGLARAEATEQILEDFQKPDSVALRWGPARCWRESLEALRSIRCLSQGNAEPFFVAEQKPLEKTLDLRGKFLKVWIRVEEMRQLAAFELRVSSDNFSSNYFAFTLPLFGDLEFNVVQDETWAVYTFSFANARVEGTPDRAHLNSIGWLARDAGHGNVDLALAGVAAVPAPKVGSLSITFDDGAIEQWEAVEIMAKHGFRGTAYIIPEQVGLSGFLSLEQLHTMHERYGWQIAGHHGIPLTQMTRRQLDRALWGVRRYLEAQGFGPSSAHFAYPLGKIDNGDTLRLARHVFETARMAGSGPETLPPADPHKLRVLNVLNTTPPADVIARARTAIDNGDWLILMFHKLRSPAADALEYEPEAFVTLIRGLADAGITPETVDQVWARYGRP